MSGAWTFFYPVKLYLQAVMSLRFALKFVEIRPAEASEACMRQKIPGGLGGMMHKVVQTIFDKSDRRSAEPGDRHLPSFVIFLAWQLGSSDLTRGKEKIWLLC